jgi:hypothetical protein
VGAPGAAEEAPGAGARPCRSVLCRHLLAAAALLKLTPCPFAAARLVAAPRGAAPRRPHAARDGAGYHRGWQAHGAGPAEAEAGRRGAHRAAAGVHPGRAAGRHVRVRGPGAAAGRRPVVGTGVCVQPAARQPRRLPAPARRSPVLRPTVPAPRRPHPPPLQRPAARLRLLHLLQRHQRRPLLGPRQFNHRCAAGHEPGAAAGRGL